MRAADAAPLVRISLFKFFFKTMGALLLKEAIIPDIYSNNKMI
jgi:hypothetical protein